MPKIRLIRTVSFSSGHRYWNPNLSPEENRDLFGPWASPYNHGHNYVLDVAAEGSIDSRTGMVVNIKDIDDLLQQAVVRKFDGKSINDEVPEFAIRPPTLENVLDSIRDKMPPLPGKATLVGLKLAETPTLWAQWETRKPMTLTRAYEFAASHRLHESGLSAEENVALFGKCNNPMGHGHNYILEVSVSGEPDPRTGMLVRLEDLDRIVHEQIVDRYDHKNFNTDLSEFEGLNPTSEIVTQSIYDRLKSTLPVKLERICLRETARNAFEVSGQ